jgi:hypothetical protein
VRGLLTNQHRLLQPIERATFFVTRCFDGAISVRCLPVKERQQFVLLRLEHAVAVQFGDVSLGTAVAVDKIQSGLD